MTRFEKWSVLIGSALTGITGVAYLWVKYAMEPVDPFAVINHPIQPWLLKAHLLVAPFLVFAVGMIALRHVWRHFRSGVRWGRRSGIVTGLSLLPMVLTGYLIQSITHEAWLGFVTLAHIVSSLLFVVGLAVHAVLLARILARGAGEFPRERAAPAPGRLPVADSANMFG